MQKTVVYIFIVLTCLMGFSAMGQYNLVGNAQAQPGGCIVLTNSQTFQMGAMWFNQQVDLRKDLDVRARLFLGSGMGNGADGMAFVLQRQSTTAGSSGEGLGYQGITPSVIVEFDTYRNNNLADPNNRHMALMFNGSANHSAALTPPVDIVPGAPFVDNGGFIDFRFKYTAATHRTQVFVNCQLRIDYLGDILTEQFGGQPFVFWGFTAATGGQTNQHQVCNIFNDQLTLLRRSDTLCLGDSVRLQPAPLPNATYSWSPATELSRADVATPWCKATESRRYICTITDTCYNLVFKDTIDVFVPPVVPHNSSATTRLCTLEQLALNTDPVLPGYEYGWRFPDGSLASGAQIQTAATQSGTYVAEVLRSGCRIYQQTHQVEVLPAPPATIVGDTAFCGLDTLRWTGPANVDAWFWRNPIGQVVGTQQQLVLGPLQASQAGLYSLETRLQGLGCLGRDTALLLVSPQAIAQMSPKSIQLCEGETFLAEVFATSPVVFSPASWVASPASNGLVVVRPDTSGRLQLSSTTGPGCTASDSVQVQWYRRPVVDAGSNQMIFAGNPLLLQGSFSGDGLHLRWRTAAGQSVGQQAVVTTFPSITTTYVFAAESLVGCGIAEDSLQVRVLPKIAVPNAFSPNGDGLNDRWIIAGIVQYLRPQLQIFNRQGQRLFSGRPTIAGWDGMFNGKPLPAATYYYLLEAEELGKTMSGWILLIR